MNQFQYLTAPCLVCKRQKRGPAWGITPDKAVCDDCYADKPEAAQAALNAAEAEANKVRDEREKQKRRTNA